MFITEIPFQHLFIECQNELTKHPVLLKALNPYDRHFKIGNYYFSVKFNEVKKEVWISFLLRIGPKIPECDYYRQIVMMCQDAGAEKMVYFALSEQTKAISKREGAFLRGIEENFFGDNQDTHWFEIDITKKENKK